MLYTVCMDPDSHFNCWVRSLRPGCNLGRYQRMWFHAIDAQVRELEEEIEALAAGREHRIKLKVRVHTRHAILSPMRAAVSLHPAPLTRLDGSDACHSALQQFSNSKVGWQHKLS